MHKCDMHWVCIRYWCIGVSYKCDMKRPTSVTCTKISLQRLVQYKLHGGRQGKLPGECQRWCTRAKLQSMQLLSSAYGKGRISGINVPMYQAHACCKMPKSATKYRVGASIVRGFG